MDPWLGKTVFLAGTVTMFAIRAPHIRRSVKIKVVKSRKGALETVLLSLVGVGFLLQLIWVVSPLLAFADYPLLSVPFAAGVVCLLLGLWLLHRSHVDLGAGWSNTLEVREHQQLVTHGLYRHVRHPMYLALLLYLLGQTLVVPNWLAGPSFFVTFALLFALRLGPEERMMREEFGAAYEAYRARTRRLVPGCW